MTLPAAADVVVVGSGITGAAAAAAAAARGASVVLLDKEDGPAREGSGRAQGSLRLQGRHASEFPLAKEALRLWREAAAEEDIELLVGGNLYFCTREEELALLRSLVTEAHDAGLNEVELLDPLQTREIIPAATGPFLAAMWSPVDAQCQPEKGTELYVRRARQAGATVSYGAKVTRLLETGRRITGVRTTVGPIRSPAVVVAAGIWTPYLANSVGLKVPIMPVCMSELETRPIEPLFRPALRAFGFGARQRPSGQVIVSGGLNALVTHGVSLYDLNGLRYWIPRAASFRKHIRLYLDAKLVARQVLARSTLDMRLVPLRSPEPPPVRRSVDRALARLATVIPGMRGAAPSRYWGGMVDMTPDGLPIIDGTSGPQGLTIITGLSGHGFTLGPVLGAIAADLALDGLSSWPIAPFRLSRFAEGPIRSPEMMI
ncbi:MAG: NAD(P)/FAD-dependent oxidoreductase [Candidatus Limnocylindrales bacterium]